MRFLCGHGTLFHLLNRGFCLKCFKFLVINLKSCLILISPSDAEKWLYQMMESQLRSFREHAFSHKQLCSCLLEHAFWCFVYRACTDICNTQHTHTYSDKHIHTQKTYTQTHADTLLGTHFLWNLEVFMLH